jgi:DNA-binding NarL/FixJ family response regulator
MIRVLVAEDHPMFREALVTMLEADKAFAVVGAVGSGNDAVAAAQQNPPDVVVMDLEMPDGGGITATAQILASLPDTRVLVLTSHDDDRNVYAALRAGAHGYLLKTASADDVLAAIAAVGRGGGMFSGTVVGQISRHFVTGGRAGAGAVFPELTQREREVLELMAQGHSNTYIADHFVLSLKTVRNHVSNVIAKLSATTRAEAIARARDVGLGSSAPYG